MVLLVNIALHPVVDFGLCAVIVCCVVLSGQ